MENFRSYLQLLYKKWRLFYYYTLLFSIATLFCVFILRHTVPPIYVYTMYSYPIPTKTESYTFKILVNNREINTFDLLKDRGDIIRANLYRFYYLKTHNLEDNFYYVFKSKINTQITDKLFNKVLKYDTLNDEIFGKWLVSNLEPIAKTKITSLTVYKSEITFLKNIPKISNNAIILDYKNE